MRTIGPAAFILLAGCGIGAPADPNLARYRGEVLGYGDARLRFPDGTVDAIERAGDRLVWARLVPDGRSSRDLVERYLIDLGRPGTGADGPLGYQLGYGAYLPEDERRDLGDGYTLYCTRLEQRVPAFNCAALLRSLPRAAVAFARVPVAARDARRGVDRAEAFLRRAMRASRNGAPLASPAVS